MTVLRTSEFFYEGKTSLKRSILNSVNEKLRFGSVIMPRVTVTVFSKKNAKMTVLDFYEGRCVKWCQMVMSMVKVMVMVMVDCIRSEVKSNQDLCVLSVPDGQDQ